MTVNCPFADHLRRFATLCASLALLCATAGISHAQPDPNDQPKAQNPPAQNALPFANFQAWQRMTPDQRRVAGRQAVDQTLRTTMTWLGFADRSIQDAVVAAAMERETQLDMVREKHRVVAQAVINKEITNEQMTELMNQLQTAIEEADAQWNTSRNALDEKIHFTRQPKLAAFLALSGVTGEGSSFTGGILGNVMSAMANVAAAQQPRNNEPAAAPGEPAQ